MKRFLQELDLKQRDYTVHCDSQSATDLSKKTMYHLRTKNIDVRYHWAIKEQLFQIRKIHTNENTTNMMAKVITKKKKNWHNVSRTRA